LNARCRGSGGEEEPRLWRRGRRPLDDVRQLRGDLRWHERSFRLDQHLARVRNAHRHGKDCLSRMVSVGAPLNGWGIVSSQPFWLWTWLWGARGQGNWRQILRRWIPRQIDTHMFERQCSAREKAPDRERKNQHARNVPQRRCHERASRQFVLDPVNAQLRAAGNSTRLHRKRAGEKVAYARAEVLPGRSPTNCKVEPRQARTSRCAGGGIRNGFTCGLSGRLHVLAHYTSRGWMPRNYAAAAKE
jgi:hypothetical protein